MKKYSQFEEQPAIIAGCVREPHVANGKFLDIGAWHPTCFSNTRALYELGWSGVMIEPSPEPFLNLLKEYGKEPRITLVCAAVGWENGLAEIHASADGVSTIDAAHMDKWKDIGGYVGKFLTPTLTWSDIFNRFGGFDFINIDAEGISADLFFKLMETECRPHCICLEHDGRMNEITERATAQGYRITYGNGTNVVMVMHG